MNYRQNKKLNKYIYLYIIIFLSIFLFVIFFFNQIFNNFSRALHFVSEPAFSLTKGSVNNLDKVKLYFRTKNSLINEVDNYRNETLEIQAKLANYNTLKDENNKLKEELGRKINVTSTVLATILSKPNASFYDTLVIDIGGDFNIKKDAIVYASGEIPIGKINDVYSKTSKVVLFSTAGEKNQVSVEGQDSLMELIGRGGGNFEMIIPRDFILPEGSEVTLPGINPHAIARMLSIISDPRDSTKKALLVSPVNIQNLKFVQVETQK